MRLDRILAPVGPVYALCGINPSTADADTDDATIRKDIGFITRWGGSRLIKFNVFGYRATDVRELAKVADPFGPDLDSYTDQIISEADVLIPCWGNRSKIPQKLRPALIRMKEKLRDSGKPVMVFGFTKSGDPKHPLMLGYDTLLRSMYL
jgi:hypothetical protein